MTNKTIIWGAGGHALVVADAMLASGEAVAGFIDTVNTLKAEEKLLDLPVWPSFEVAKRSCGSGDVTVAIGFGHCAARMSLIEELARLGVSLKAVIHPRSVVSRSARLGRGVFVAPCAVIEANCSIGDGAIVNTGSVICHECSVGTGASICPNVCIGGKTRVGQMSWIGIGSTIIDKVNIGQKCYVGAGSVVVDDLPDDVMAYGVPARVIRASATAF